MGNVSLKAMNNFSNCFGKYILKPNERGNDILLFKWHLYINTEITQVVGAEVEYRKQLLIPILTTQKKLSAGLNASLYTVIKNWTLIK
jgi:hypothetical protein